MIVVSVFGRPHPILLRRGGGVSSILFYERKESHMLSVLIANSKDTEAENIKKVLGKDFNVFAVISPEEIDGFLERNRTNELKLLLKM